MDFEFSDVVMTTDDPYYDLFQGGYIKPRELLVDEHQIATLELAVGLIQEFLEQAGSQGVLEVC
jgi:hypothetical protein